MLRTEKARETGSEQQPEKFVGAIGVRFTVGFFLQPLALCMNLLCPAIAPSLRPSSQKTVTRTCKSDETV